MEKQTVALIKCQECGATISDKALRCPQCGASVEAVVCKECGKPIPHEALTCPHCGIPIKVAYHMGFGEAIGTCFKKYATFKGRARRAEYWYFLLFTLSLGVFVWLLSYFSWITQADVYVLNMLIFVVTITPTLAVTVRRFHDMNKSGWNLLWIIIPCIYSVSILPLANNVESDIGEYLFMVALACNLTALIVMFIWPITKSFNGENKYGPSPLYK